MAQDYDKIFKENLDGIIIPLAEKVLHIHPEQMEDINPVLQITIEREPDFLKRLIASGGGPGSILQIEIQTEDEPEMITRMLEYFGILRRRFKLPVLQYVIFIGDKQPKMEYKLKEHNIDFSFTLINLHDIDYKLFIDSDKPEEIILGILANFGKDKPETVAEKILGQIKSLKIETNRKRKSVIHLEVLSKLRNLQELITKKIEDMSFTYDLKTDIRFIQGKNEGKGEGKEEGKKEGVDSIIINFLQNTNLTISEIAKGADVPVSKVEKLAKKIRRGV